MAIRNSRDIATYIAKKLSDGAMLGPFDPPPPYFAPWCQSNPLLTRPKRESPDQYVIMDLS